MRRIVLIATLASSGCSDFEFGPQLTPWLVDYTLELPPEGQMLLRSEFDFFDPDGDVVSADAILHRPSGEQKSFVGCRIPPRGKQIECVAALAGDELARTFDNVTQATMRVSFYETTALGDYTVEVWLIDREGFTSNHVTTDIHVIDPDAPPPE